MYSLGNHGILKNKMLGFLCPRKIPADIILKTYDWAIEQREKGICIISGFHSKIEKDVFQFLLKGDQPIIMALGRGLKKRYEPEIANAIEKNRLLIISPFDTEVKRITTETAYKRNELIYGLVDEIFIPFINENGLTQQLVIEAHKIGKVIQTF